VCLVLCWGSYLGRVASLAVQLVHLWVLVQQQSGSDGGQAKSLILCVALWLACRCMAVAR
jgi:hypothetical protein